MNIETILQGIDLSQISKITTLQVDHVTCVECCKYFIVPSTAICGHTLCHKCWHGRRNCPTCGMKVEKKSLRLNLVLQNRTEHIHSLADALQELFNIKWDDNLFSPDADLVAEKEPNKNVSDWLASSQNHFSAPVSSQHSQEINEPQKLIVSDIQIHTKSNKNVKPTTAIFVPMEQQDWDKIEPLPDSEYILNRDKENIVGPMDIETYITNDDLEYSTNNPRRSSRNKDCKESESVRSIKINNLNKNSEKWSNVKKMKKEFGKLNKNKNKLNVSIEMCKKVKRCDLNTKPDKVQNNHKDHYDGATIVINPIQEINHSPSLKQNANVNNKNIENIKHISSNLLHNEDNISRSEKEPESMEVDKSTSNNLRQSVNAHNNICKPNVTFFKKNVLIGKDSPNIVNVNNFENFKSQCFDNDDIEITIKIGTTLTNICIKKKENDVQLKINSDRELQTSITKIDTVNKVNVSTSPIKASCLSNQISQSHNNTQKRAFQLDLLETKNLPSQKSSTKKNTASADTSTINMEITESIEKELSTVMENVPPEKVDVKTLNNLAKDSNAINSNNNQEDVEFINDLDIFDSESVKEGNVQALKDTKHTPSAILMSTNKSKIKTQKHIAKRDREMSEVDAMPCSKKSKTADDKLQNQSTQMSHNTSEVVNYDKILSQVFANIDADMKGSNKNTEKLNTHSISHTHNQISQKNIHISQARSVLSSQNKNTDNAHARVPQTQKYSENIFSLIEKDEDIDLEKSEQIKNKTLCESINTNMYKNLDKATNMLRKSQNDLDIIEMSTPINDDDSDKSVVEETPQKNISISKIKQIDGVTNRDKILKLNNYGEIGVNNHQNKIEENRDTVNIVSSETIEDSTKSSRNITVVEQVKPRITLETPISINKFVDQIKHKSTPVARKSLNFSTTNDDIGDIDQTLCPTAFEAAKNTQEIEIMKKAFEQNDLSSQNIIVGRNNRKDLKYYIACSCLSVSEKANVKQLCASRNWIFVDNYVDELTHLVVGVDEENKAQRSVKFMCALAASKWIVAYDWVQRCLQTSQIVDEEPYEALDATGEPGPKRSRLAKQKLFHGIKFFCMPPFGVLDVDTLKMILQAAGGKVVSEARDVKVTETPALLLAEPESTQEDKFIYLAMELCIVPLNYEWVLNCLGSYALCSIHELLLCPSSLLPSVTSKWPLALISREYD